MFVALLALGTAPLVIPPAAQAADAHASLRVVQVSPSVPPPTTAITPLDVTIEITNTTSTSLTDMKLLIVREPPLLSTRDLRRALNSPVEGGSQLSRLPSVPVAGELAPKQTRTITVALQTSTDASAPNTLCLCRTGVYPLDFSLQAATGSTSDVAEQGWTQTYIPSTGDAQMTVSWLWPLLDRPHRTIADGVFFDDDLAASVAPGGRLDRALAALEDATSVSDVTLILDPEVLDELIVMTQGYRVVTAAGNTAGTGGHDASAWLARFKVVLSRVDGYSLTPFADPDVDALTRAGMSWQPELPPAVSQRLASVLGITNRHDIAWPAGETITAAALSPLVNDGAQAVLVNAATLPGSATSSGGHVELEGSTASALVESADVSAQLDSVVDVGGHGLGALPALVSSAVMPALDETNNFLILAPQRWVDADPQAAAAAINATASGPFRPLGLRAALVAVPTYPGGPLAQPSGAQDQEVPASQLELAAAAMTTATTVSTTVSAADAVSLLEGYPAARQRGAASGWRVDHDAAVQFSAILTGQAALLNDAIRIVPPANRSYNLASNDSPLLLTVLNTLPYTASVVVGVSSVGDVRGFRANDSSVQEIPAGSQVTVHVDTHVDRSGHFVVSATLSTPAGVPLGRPQRLSIYSRALGTIGVVITIVAGSILAIALIIRFSRRISAWQRRRRSGAEQRGVEVGS